MIGKPLRELLEEMLEQVEAIRGSHNSIRQSRYVNLAFLRWLEESWRVSTPDGLRRSTMEAYQIHLAGLTVKGRPLNPKSINKQICLVKNLLKYLSSHGYVPAHLEVGLQYVKEPKLLPGSVLIHDQARQMLESVGTDTSLGYRDRTLLELMYTSGIRAGELVGMDVGHVDFPNGVARVLGKGEKERITPIGKTALKFLENYIKGVRPFLISETDEQALFLNLRGKRITYCALLKLVHAHARRSKMPVNVTPHTFRRSCTTELIRSGAGMYHVKELLGHESLATLKHYAKLTINDLKQEHLRCHPRERDGLSHQHSFSV